MHIRRKGGMGGEKWRGGGRRGSNSTSRQWHTIHGVLSYPQWTSWLLPVRCEMSQEWVSKQTKKKKKIIVVVKAQARIYIFFFGFHTQPECLFQACWYWSCIYIVFFIMYEDEFSSKTSFSAISLKHLLHLWAMWPICLLLDLTFDFPNMLPSKWLMWIRIGIPFSGKVHVSRLYSGHL